MNVELLKQVRSHIMEHPEQFTMAAWVTSGEGAACRRCIGGRAVELSGVQLEYTSEGAETSCRVLEITAKQGSRLFYTNAWQKEFELAHNSVNELTDEDAPKVRAEAAARQIDWFIDYYANVEPIEQPEFVEIANLNLSWRWLK